MRVFAAVVCVVVVAVSSSAAVAENRQFRIATLAPSGSPWANLLERAAAEIAERTERRVTVKYYTGGQQGDERDYIRKIKAGQLDGAAVTSIGLSMIEPSIRVLELPMLFESEAEVDYVATKMWPYFQKKFEAKGFRLAERGELGWIYLMSKSKIATLDDLRKHKMCMLGDDPLAGSLLEKLKLNSVPLSIPEVDSALTSGRINACLNSPLGAVALQWYSKVKFMSARPLVFAIGATIMSVDAVNKVAPANRKVIEMIAKSNQKKARAIVRKANADAHKLILKKGITLVEPTAATVEEMTALAGEVQRAMTGKVFSKEELAMVIAHRDEFRAKQAKPAAK
jgi:TRAP-type C4-dicarboxylate transport system substrate-binding protein